MKVVILCGGRGTRLNELTEAVPKPLVEIGGRPILWHIMKFYSHFGFKDFVLCLGYKGDKIKQYFMEYQSWKNHDFTFKMGSEEQVRHHRASVEDWTITFANTGINTNTGGRLKRIEKYIDTEQFLCTYGDGLSDIDINALIAFHEKKGLIGTLTCVRPLSQFGILKLDDGKVVDFHEKPRLADYINAGFFVFRKEFFKYLGDDDVLEQTPLQNLAKDGQLAAYKYNGFWHSMDTFKDSQTLNDLWQEHRASWKVWEQP